MTPWRDNPPYVIRQWHDNQAITSISPPKESHMARPRTPQPPVHLVSARMLDVISGALVEPGDLLVEGDRITGVSPKSVPHDALEIDLGDVTMLPGLMDMEVNLVMGGPNHTSPSRPAPYRRGGNSQRCGRGPQGRALSDQVRRPGHQGQCLGWRHVTHGSGRCSSVLHRRVGGDRR